MRAGSVDRPEVENEQAALIFRKGLAHERASLESLRGEVVHECVQDPPPPLTPGLDRRYGRTVDWNWMQRYRVWRANRKEFLAPENWLEPELRHESAPPPPPPVPRSRFRRPRRTRSDTDT